MVMILNIKTGTGLASLSNRILRADRLQMFEPEGNEAVLSGIKRDLSDIEQETLSSIVSREQHEDKVKLTDKEIVALSMVRARICPKERLSVFVSHEIEALDECVSMESQENVQELNSSHSGRLPPIKMNKPGNPGNDWFF